MNRKCLYCYKPLGDDIPGDFHVHCSTEFFGLKTPPELGYSFAEMAELARNIVERSVAVPGVQPKLSLSIVNEVMSNGNRGRLTIVGAMGGGYIFKPPVEKYPEMPQKGKKRKLEKEHFVRFAEGMGLNAKQINGAFRRFLKNRPLAMQWIGNSFLSDDLKTAYSHLLNERYQRLN